jgi:hypothetical protein
MAGSLPYGSIAVGRFCKYEPAGMDGRLKKLLAEMNLDNAVLLDVLSKKSWPAQTTDVIDILTIMISALSKISSGRRGYASRRFKGPSG